MVKQDYRIATVDRALDILEYLAQQRGEFSLPELSRSLRLPTATLFRYLVTLEERGYVSKNPDTDKYTLGLRILHLGDAVLSNLTLHELALPYMKQLVQEFQETVNLGLLDGSNIVYIEILESPRAFKTSSRIGVRDPLHATSLGKAMLAFLPAEEVDQIVQAAGLPRRTPRTICDPAQFRAELEAIRRRGYAVDQEENEVGAYCVGAPIFDHRGRPIAAMSVSAPAFRISKDTIQGFGSTLLRLTSDISNRIGYDAEH